MRRLRPGEVVSAADGGGSVRSYVVDRVDRDEIALRATGAAIVEPQLVPLLTVAFCLTKGDKPQTVVQKLTELGVDRIRPVMSARSVVKWEQAQAEAAVERWRRVALEAAEQCRRSRLPEVVALAPLESVAQLRMVVVADQGGDANPRDLIDQALTAHDEITLVVGPEGGFDPDEVESLGPVGSLAVAQTVLRAETAAIAAAALLTGARWNRTKGASS